MRNGFTLAEVLVTLGIIGIVAAMTLPAVVNKYREKVFITAAKRGYSNVVNAINRWNADNSIVGDYSFYFSSNNNNGLAIELAKKLNAVKVCTNSQVKNCGGAYKVKRATKTNNGKGETAVNTVMNANRIVLSDGSFIAVQTEVQNGSCTHTYWSYERDTNGNFIEDSSSPNGFKGQYKTSSNCGFIHIDTNGLKGPNQIGRDNFVIGFYPYKIYSRSDVYGNLDYVLANDKLIETEQYEIGKY